MNAARGVRGIVASVFVIGAVTAGFAVTAMSVGAGVVQPPDGTAPDGGIRCRGDAVVAPAAPPDGEAGRSCAQLEITKTVTGTPAPAPPPGTTYAVKVDCVPVEVERMGPLPTDGVTAQQLPEALSPPFTTTLTFPENGGTQSVFVDRPSDCTVTESPPPGCTLTSIDPGTTEIRNPILYGVTVTNNCDPRVEAAVAVVEAPRFTG
ncbi:MAG TPA: DUF5979 domain-containing protein [Acidimicrobiia bacterium]|nr:DUF5979 domain-containing protein [Acidimicrobiia bacterium]